MDPAALSAAEIPRLTPGRWVRRSVTLPVYVIAWFAFTALLPIVLFTSMVVDTIRFVARGIPCMSVRIALTIWCYLTAELVGLLVLGAAWITSLGRRRTLQIRAYAIQQSWARAQLGVLERLFELKIEVEGEQCLRPGPLVVFMRHASIIDVLLPAVLVGEPESMRLRYVLKRELLMDPCLDVAGNWLPNCFVERGSEDSDSQVAAVRALASDLGPEEGVMIYPEGTRFSQDKRARVIERLRERNPELARHAASLQCVLPPRFGGPLALLESGADVVFCAHVGLAGLNGFYDIWKRGLSGQTIRVAFWRVPAADIPGPATERRGWLLEQWARVDEWVQAHAD